MSVLTARVESLQDKTCNCKEGPALVGQGTADVPFELEYADEVVLPLSGRRDLYSSIALLLSKPIAHKDQTHSYNPVANPGISEVSSQT